MTALRETLRRLGEPTAISWPVFWLTYLVNIVMAVTTGFDLEVDSWQRIVAATVSQVAMFAFLLPVRTLILRRLDDNQRGLVTFGAFLMAGAIRGAVVGGVFLAMGTAGSEVFIPRLPAGIAFGAAVLTPVALAVIFVRLFRRTRGHLLARRDSLAATQAALEQELVDRDAAVLRRVRNAFEDAMRHGSDATDYAERLQLFNADVVRPLSHSLSRGNIAVEFPVEPALVGRVTVRDILDEVTRGRPFRPWLTASLAAALSLSWSLRVAGPIATVLFIVLGTVIYGASLAAMNAVTVRVLPRRSIAGRVAIIVAAALAAGILFGIAAEIVVQWFPGLAAPWAGALTFGPLFALTISAVSATARQLRQALHDLAAVDDLLDRQVVRLHQAQWVRQRASARALHGPVQSFVAGAVAQLQEGVDERRVLEELRARLVETLDPETLEGAQPTWRMALERVEATWKGVCDVHASIPSTAAQALDADPLGSAIASEIITEAVSNAIRHGHARRVTIDMDLSPGLLGMTIDNDGGPLRTGPDGLGTQVLRACTLDWDRGAAPHGSRLRAALPVD